jgi:hypothetical protein
MQGRITSGSTTWRRRLFSSPHLGCDDPGFHGRRLYGLSPKESLGAADRLTPPAFSAYWQPPNRAAVCFWATTRRGSTDFHPPRRTHRAVAREGWPQTLRLIEMRALRQERLRQVWTPVCGQSMSRIKFLHSIALMAVVIASAPLMPRRRDVLSGRLRMPSRQNVSLLE